MDKEVKDNKGNKENIDCSESKTTLESAESAKKFFCVKLNKKYGAIDQTNKEIIPLKYDDIWSFNEGLSVVKLNGKWGYIDKTGKEVIPLK